MPLVEKTGTAVLREVQVEWKISVFKLYFIKVGNFFHSPVFNFGSGEWYLRLYPCGETVESPGQIGLYLMAKESIEYETVYFTLGIQGSDGVEEMEEVKYTFSRLNKGYGFPNFWIRLELMKRESSLLPHNTLTITCDLRRNPRLTAITGEKKLGKSLLSMLESGEDSDVVIRVQEKAFRVHRNILRSRSPVFKSMFTHEMIEKRSGVVTIQDCDSKTFHDFLTHIYSGSSEFISAENVFGLYTAAEKYDINDLKEECVKFLKRKVTVVCFCDVMRLAVKYCDKELIESATAFFCDNSLDIVKTAEWQTFLDENATVGNELIIKTLTKNCFTSSKSER